MNSSLPPLRAVQDSASLRTSDYSLVKILFRELVQWDRLS